MLIKVRSLTYHRDWEREAIFLMFAFQRDGLKVLEKSHSWIIVLHLKRAEEKLSKVTAPRKEEEVGS